MLDIKHQQSLLKARIAWLEPWRGRGRAPPAAEVGNSNPSILCKVLGCYRQPLEKQAASYSVTLWKQVSAPLWLWIQDVTRSIYLLQGFLVTELYIYSASLISESNHTLGLQISEIEVPEHLCNLSICVPLINLTSQAWYWSSSPYMKYHRAFLDSYCYHSPQSFHGP